MADEATPPPPHQSAVSPSAPRTDPLAIVSLVLAILSWISCLLLASIPAIICGHKARSRIRRSNGTLGGMNFAIAALIIAYLEIPFGVLGGIMLVDMIRSERVRLKELAVQQREITSEDGKLKVTTSGFWVQRTDLNKRASLQASRKDKELYVIVISYPKSSDAAATLEQRHQATRDQMTKDMANSSATAPISITIDEHRALQDEVTGTQKGTVLTFLHTTVDDGNSFHQILAWTLKSRWDANKAELADVTSSFHSGK